CTQAGTSPGEPDGVSGVATSPPGTSHTFAWNSTADLPHTTVVNVAVRVRASIGGVFGSFVAPVVVTVANGMTFEPASLTGIYDPACTAIADVNGDGKPDIVVASEATGITVFLGNGDGTFKTQVPWPVGAAGSYPVSVAIADLNGDGKLDLVTANYDENKIAVLLGVGDGTFEPAVKLGAIGLPYAVTVGDLRGTGELDIITANWSGTATVLLAK
ncbi:MAG TPA: VCBS repeat-containing protein, partial [Planctomycetota bacterium]|nr:VCBS repeat-containing protein [Planctomycetota bacterium]